MSNARIFPTGITGLDQILDGGLWGGEMTELVGQPASGKTQICMFAALNIAKQNNTVLYIDSANSFSSERISLMCPISDTASQGNEAQQLLKPLNMIHCRKCFDVFALTDILHELQEKLLAKELPFYCGLKLVVIDSIGALLSPILGGKQAQGHALMTNAARLIKSIATTHHIAFLVTNYIVSGGGGDNDRASHKAALGMSWTYAPNTQVTLHFEPISESRKAVLTKSSHSATSSSTFFKIDAQGVSAG